jgi:zinc protease
MRRIAAGWLAACVAVTSLAASARPAHAQAAPETGGGDITESTLANGVRIIVAPRHTVAITAIDVWVGAGTRREPPGKEGVAHYLEHVLFTGTPTRPSEQDIDGAIEDLGGTLDGGTSYDWAHFYTVVPSASFPDALSVMADTLQHASLTQESIDSERPIIESEIDRDGDDNTSMAQDVVRAALYGPSHPYGGPITGTTEQVQNITRDDVSTFYHTYYVPSNVAVVVSGDVTADQVQSVVQADFGAWKGSAAPDETDLPAASLPAVSRQVVSRPGNDSFLVMGWPAPSVSEQPDAWTMDVLLTYLGQGAENAIDDDLHRSRHLLTTSTADFLTQRDPGILTVTVELPTANMDTVRAGILAHVRALQRQPLTDAQLAGAKQELISSYLFDTETVAGKADALGFYETINTYKYDVDYIDHVNQVTSAMLMQVAQKYLSADVYAECDVVPPQDPQNVALPRHSSIQMGSPALVMSANNPR